MPVFLFMKQIVDMFYQYQILDYGMVVLCLFLLYIKMQKDKIYKNPKEFFCLADYLVIALMVIYGLSFLRYPSAYGIFFKVESCFLLYFLGRLYGGEVLKYGKVLASAGYIVVYVNFLYRFYQFGLKFVVTGSAVTLLNVGGLYYYKTDLAIGIIIAVLFIYMFSEVKWLKWITIVPICGYMVFYSGARIGKLIMAIEYLLILLYELQSRGHFNLRFKEKYVVWIMGTVSFLVLLFFIVLQFFPFEAIASNLSVAVGQGSFLEKLMHSRHIVWWDILDYFSDQSLLIRFLGIDLETEYLHNSLGIRAHSMYIKQMYSTGYVGCFLLVAFLTYIFKKVVGETDKSLKYIVLILWVMLLGAGLTIESLEATQMSWFPMLFSGVVISSSLGREYAKNNNSVENSLKKGK